MTKRSWFRRAAPPLLATALFSQLSHADSATDYTAAQQQALREAYEQGYNAARAQAQGSKVVLPAVPQPPASAFPAPAPALSPAPKPLLDIKEVYSDAGDSETVREMPVAARPLSSAAGTPQAPLAIVPSAAIGSARPPAPASQDEQVSPEEQQEIQNLIKEIRDWGNRQAAQRASQGTPPPGNAVPAAAPQASAAPISQPAPAVSDQQYEDDAQEYARALSARTSRAPAGQAPPVDTGPLPADYSSAPASTYAPPPPPAVSQNQAAPASREGMYWSPQYGRWLSY